MYIGSSQNNFKRRRKESVSLKPVNPVSLKSDVLTKFLKNMSCCFKKKRQATDVGCKQSGKSLAVIQHSNLIVSQKDQQDLTPLLREITTNFFENNCCRFSDDAYHRLDKNKSESSLCTCNPRSRESCRRKKSKRLSKNSVVSPNSDIGLDGTRQCISASAFLTTSFFSLSHKPEYSTYPIHINLHYAEEHPSDSNKSSQYCEKDFSETNRNAKTSTRGLQCFSDNSTQSAYMCDYVDYLAENITQKVAHFFEITPPKKNKLKQQNEKTTHTSEKSNKATSTSNRFLLEEEPTLLYVNSIKHFISTDDTTVESKLGFDDDRSKSNYRERKVLKAHTTRPLLTKNCCTSTSDTCICSEMCPKFKEWYEFLQNNMKNHNANFRHFGQLKNISSSKISDEKEEIENCCLPEYAARNITSNTDITEINKPIDSKEMMRELSELETSLNNYDNYATQRNLLDILNQRYPTFIGFQFNNNESRKLTYSINKKAISPTRNKRVPKIIIREKKKRNTTTDSKTASENENAKQFESNSRTSARSVATNNANVLEIREIIESLLPQDPSKFKMISSEFLQKSGNNQKINRLNKSNSKEDEILRSEVEKIVDELLDEVPSTSRDIERSKASSNFKGRTYSSWNLKNDSSLSSFSNDIELSSLGENNFEITYSGKHASQTVVPLFHKLKMRAPKKTRLEDKVKFHLVKDIESKTTGEENTITMKKCDYSSHRSLNQPKKNNIQDLNETKLNSIKDEQDRESDSLNKSFYAQIVQKTASAEHPLIRTKLSQSSSKSSLNSFIKNLLICLKYAESKSQVQDASIQCNDHLKNSSSSKTSMKNKVTIPLKKGSSISTLISSGTFTNWKENRLIGISPESEKVDKSNMFSQQTNTIGVQVLIAKHLKDKETPSSFTKFKIKKGVMRDTCTQTRLTPKGITCPHSTSMQCDNGFYKQKGNRTHLPSSSPSANKKVSENRTRSKDIGIFSTPVEQEISPRAASNHNSTTLFNQYNFKVHSAQNSLKDIKRGKSCNLLSSSSNTSSSWVRSKTHSDGTIPTFDINSLITSSLSKDLDKRKMRYRFSNQLYENNSSTIKAALCSDSGSGDTQENILEVPSCERSILPPQDENTIALNVCSTSQNPFLKEGDYDGENHLQTTLLHNSDSNLLFESHNSTTLLYEANDLNGKNIFNPPFREKTSVTAEEDSADEMKHLSASLTSNSVLSEAYSEKSSGSDIYKFEPTETILDDSYLERIRHLWLKSGLRQHLSRLSNLELKPVHEWRKLALLETEEPTPVLEKLDIASSVPMQTEKVRITHRETIPDTSKEESDASLLADMKKEAEKLDKSLLPALFNKLTMLEKDKKFQIQLSSSDSEQDTIEPALTNVGPSLEKLDNEFIDWVIGLGIPLTKISWQEVQTSQEYLQKKSARRIFKIVDDKACWCDDKTWNKKHKAVQVKGALPESLTNSVACITSKKSESKTLYYSKFEENTSGRNIYEHEEKPYDITTSNIHASIPQNTLTQPTILDEMPSTRSHSEFLTSKEDIQKEILNILYNVINKLQYKVQEETLKLGSIQDRNILKAPGTFQDYCGLKDRSFAGNIENFATARSYDISQEGKLQLDEDLKERLLFAITSLTKLLAKFCAKFNGSDLMSYYNNIESELYKCDLDRNISPSSFISSLHNIVENVDRPYERHMLNITKSSTSRASSRGYFSDTSFASNHANVSTAPSDDSRSGNLLYCPVNHNRKYITKADKKCSSKHNTGKSIKNSSNTNSTNSLKETRIRRSLDDFFYNILYSSSPSELSEYTEVPSQTRPNGYSYLDRKSSEIHLLFQQYKNCIESEKRSCSELSSNSRSSNSSYICGIRENTSTGFTYLNRQVPPHLSKSLPDYYLSPDDMSDIWDLIKLLSELCPRVLCKYYIKRILN
ncbi:hypothetical protein Trydic_g3438 [Trypoxylus dichotomus]